MDDAASDRRSSPVQVVIIRSSDDDDAISFEEAVRLAIESKPVERDVSGAGYLDDGATLDIAVLAIYENDEDPLFRDALFNAAINTIILEVKSVDHTEWPDAISRILTDERVTEILTVNVPGPVATGNIQENNIEAGHVESGLVPIIATLGVLEAIRRTLSNTVYGNDKILPKFFISHAKVDGAPIALATVDFIRRVATLFKAVFTKSTINDLYFYDAESIKPGDDWRLKLKHSARESVLVAMRTNEYANRYWCRQEYLWAEESAAPIVIVDLRTNLQAVGDHIRFDCAPMLRVYDGNILRIVIGAVLAHINILKLRWRVNDIENRDSKCRALPRHASAASIQALYDRLDSRSSPLSGNLQQVVYPGTALPEIERQSLELFAHSLFKHDISLLSELEWEQL